MKAENLEWRKAGNRVGRQDDGTWHDGPNPSFRLTNNSANIRRLKDRLRGLEAMKARGTTEREINGVRVVENAEAARLQLFFPGKPDAQVRDRLKSNGFRWAPSAGAWQRHLNNSGRWAAQQVLRAISKESDDA
jgi:hypothetical protein